MTIQRRLPKPRSPGQIVVSVEHARCDVPKAFANLGLPERLLRSHVGWDPGAATMGRMLARKFGAPLHLGRWTRLLVDLNRSHDHHRVIPRDIRPSGRVIRANAFTRETASRAEKLERIERYWHPWRRAVEGDLDAAADAHGCGFHISVHSFVERLAGEERPFDIGLLYDPAHTLERPLADRLDARLSAAGLRVRRNQPYGGLDDGHCMRLRKQRPVRRYVGMEIEANQRRVRSPEGARAVGRALVAAFAPEFAG